MSDVQAKFVWYDLMTSDTEAAGSFYRRVIGWEAKDSGMGDRSYAIFSMGPAMVGGLMPIPEEARAMGARPMWLGYVGVDDVDACAQRVAAAGGAVGKPPEDIPGIGRFAVVADPDGAGFMLFQASGNAEPAAAGPGLPGRVGWHELHAGDGERGFAFYSSLFGWTQTEAMDMGPMGLYRLFATGGAPVGGMMTKAADMPRAAWLYYFNVDAVDAAMARVKDAGGQVLNGPMEVPGGMWIAQCVDPQGAMFALLSAKR